MDYLKLFCVFFVIFNITFAAKSKKSKAEQHLSCKDENGDSVDWFYLYKLPGQFPKSTRSSGTYHHDIRHGLEFLFITSESHPLNKWTLSNRTIDDLTSIAGHTIAQSFNPTDRLVLAYNDQSPGGKTDGSNGHTKGLVVANENGGFWMIHSVPFFPSIQDSTYTYPSTARSYGQSFLCISVDAPTIEQIGQQLVYNEPHVYQFNSSDAFSQLFPSILKVANHEKIKQSPYWNEVTIKSAKGVEFRSFAKSRHFEKELYEDWVAAALQSDLYAETWRRGPGALSSNCTKRNHVWNISELKVAEIDFSFPSLDDHSKWSVSPDDLDWICVGDINRAEHQKRRGGGTVCQKSPPISTAYRSLIHQFEPCPRNTN